MVVLMKTNIVGHDSDELDPSYYVCKHCMALEPVECDGCEHFLTIKDGSKQLRDEVDIEGTVRLCPPCSKSANVFCHACGAAAATMADNSITRFTGAMAIKDAGRTVGFRCKMCAFDAITEPGQAQAHYTAAVTWMEGWLQRNGAGDAQFGRKLTYELVLDGTIGQDGRHARAACRPVPDKPGHHKLLVLRHMRPIAFQGELVHELTHAWANNAGTGEARLIEGFCNYVAGQFLQATYPNSDEAKRAVRKMEKDKNKDYGANFIMVRDALQGKPESAVTWFKQQP
jgi:hypothetical protein